MPKNHDTNYSFDEFLLDYRMQVMHKGRSFQAYYPKKVTFPIRLSQVFHRSIRFLIERAVLHWTLPVDIRK